MRHPPKQVWVNYCAACGTPIIASKSRGARTSCPVCPTVAKPEIKIARYRLETAPGKEMKQ